VLNRDSFCSEEPYYDDDDPQEEYYSPEPQDENEQGANGAADEDADNIVPSGDPAAAAKDSVKSHKDKKIPNEQRTTTPYMTKYEKARILGTRALQIRYALAVSAGCGRRCRSKTEKVDISTA
jgi:DNA-directed RNA polymerases I, II, and III subunit RPABC2